MTAHDRHRPRGAHPAYTVVVNRGLLKTGEPDQQVYPQAGWNLAIGFARAVLAAASEKPPGGRIHVSIDPVAPGPKQRGES